MILTFCFQCFPLQSAHSRSNPIGIIPLFLEFNDLYLEIILNLYYKHLTLKLFLYSTKLLKEIIDCIDYHKAHLFYPSFKTGYIPSESLAEPKRTKSYKLERVLNKI